MAGIFFWFFDEELMMAPKSPSTLVVGLAFFSMFFGSGNLIFPLMLGSQYENHFLISACGFVVTAVLLPVLGILVMVPARGRYENLFVDLLPNRYARWFFLIVLIFWIPLGSGPRCVVLAHASIKPYLVFTPPLWAFSSLFLGLVYVCVRSRTTIITILGKLLTPALLVSIFAIVVTSFSRGEINVSSMDPAKVFFASLLDGYYTQDLIAAVFFSSALVGMLNLETHDQKIALRKTWHGGLIAAVLLVILYTALIAASAVHAEHLRNVSGEKLVSTLAHIALGNTFGGLSSIAVSLACLTTQIALVVVFADFLNHHIFRKQNNHRALLVTLAIILAMSQLEFSGIMAIISPAMKVIYPLLFALVLRYLWRSRKALGANIKPQELPETM